MLQENSEQSHEAIRSGIHRIEDKATTEVVDSVVEAKNPFLLLSMEKLQQ